MKNALEYFREISAVPRGSGDVGKIADYLEDFAKKHNLKYRRDKLDNLIIFKDATKGRENDPVVMIQGHTDMVCEKDEGVVHDFTKEGLKLIENGDIIKADGTTLGADDGVAVALMLEYLADDTLDAPALECVFTVDEEIGMLGAIDMDLSDCKAKYLINADSEQDGVFTCGCCGGSGVTFTVPVKKETKEGCFNKISLSGLKGGHSGAEIDKGRLNAIKLMAEILEAEDSIASIERDGKDNVIPARCDVIAMVNEATILDRFNAKKDEWKMIEPDIDIAVVKTDITRSNVLDLKSAKTIISMLREFPFGVQRMCEEPAGLVHTSCNLGIIHADDETLTGTISCRSVETKTKHELINKIGDIVKAAGGDILVHGEYPAWEYKKDSVLRKTMIEVYEGMFGKTPTVEVIHAGLECGVLLSKMPDLDIVSIGCEIYDIHCSKERMSMSSLLRMSDFVRNVLKVIK